MFIRLNSSKQGIVTVGNQLLHVRSINWAQTSLFYKATDSHSLRVKPESYWSNSNKGERTALIDAVRTGGRIALSIRTIRARVLSVSVVVRAFLTRNALGAAEVSTRRTENYNTRAPVIQHDIIHTTRLITVYVIMLKQ